jgi:hypothetical protein
VRLRTVAMVDLFCDTTGADTADSVFRPAAGAADLCRGTGAAVAATVLVRLGEGIAISITFKFAKYSSGPLALELILGLGIFLPKPVSHCARIYQN